MMHLLSDNLIDERADGGALAEVVSYTVRGTGGRYWEVERSVGLCRHWGGTGSRAHRSG